MVFFCSRYLNIRNDKIIKIITPVRIIKKSTAPYRNSAAWGKIMSEANPAHKKAAKLIKIILRLL